MPLLKIKPADLVKSDSGIDSIDTLVRQTMGKEPYISFSRANENPVQWIQLLNALDQQELPGWSLLAPMNIQMLKCEKCSLEFCSTISYRRHMRQHRRKLNLDKDSATKIRDSLEAFWDKLTVEEAMELMSFDDVSLAGVAGPAIIKALASFIRKLGYTPLPPSYVKSGSVLLDIVQGRPPRFPISSQELFSILDGASENTFLCAGTAESLQKFVFDGDAGKIGLEMRNVVACTSFLVEQKLVKACLADKDAVALRYQKLLVEEEEAAQKRQTVLLEKKRLKKLRQKEQRAKELPIDENGASIVESSPSPPSSFLVDDYESTREMLDIPLNAATPSPQPSQLVNVGDCESTREMLNIPLNAATTSPPPSQLVNVDDCESPREMLDIPRNATLSPQPSQLVNVDDCESTREMLDVPLNAATPSPQPSQLVNVDDYESTREMLDIPLNAATPSPQPSQLVNVEDTDKDQENRHPDYGAHKKIEHRTQGGRRQVDNSYSQAPKSHRNPNGFHSSHNHQALKPVVSQKRASSKNFHSAANTTKVWTPKPKSESHEESLETRLLVDEAKQPCSETKLLIGSITIPLGDHLLQGQNGNFGGSPGNVTSERSVEGEGNGGNTNSSVVNPIMLLRAFNRHGNGGQLPTHNSSGDSEVGGVLGNDDNVVHPTLLVESALNGCKDECTSRLEAAHQGDMEFSSHEAGAFLSERWKEAIMGDHVELVLFAEEPAGHFESQDVNNEADLSSKVDEHSILRNSENRLPVCLTANSSPPTKSKIKAKPEKGSKVKYIQKQRSGF